MEEVDRALQDFQYSFECASSRRERLRFCTLRTSGSLDELGEILSVYGDRDVIFQTNGTEHVAKTVEDAESIQRCLRDRITLTAGKKSVRWKLYYTADLRANKITEEFVGFVGLSLLESTKLEPHIRLRSDYHNQGIGRKAMICLMAKLFSNKPWLYSNVSGLFMSIHPMNKECIILKNKLLLREVSEHKNPKHADGLWVETFKLWKDRREATIPLRHFVCNSMRSLESIFLSVLNVNVNKADTLLLSRSNFLVCPEKVACPAQSNEVERLVADGYDHIDATLQNFEYTFDYGSRCEKLSFHTFKKPGSRFELEEILSLFSDVESMRYYGSEIPIQRTLAEARRWREQLRKKNSFAGEMKGFIWKVYYSADIHNSASKPSFIGFVSLSHRKISRVLSPAILLKSEYRNRGCGSKAFLCLLVRLLSKRAWFAQHFDGICMMINPENVASLALQDKVMLGFTKEKENDRRADGLWVFTRKAYCDDRVKNVTRRLFECRGVAVLESLLRAKFSSQRVNKKEMLLLADDKGGKRQITASMLDLSNKLSLHQIQLYVEDVQRLVLDLNWFKLRLRQTAPKICSEYVQSCAPR